MNFSILFCINPDYFVFDSPLQESYVAHPTQQVPATLSSTVLHLSCHLQGLSGLWLQQSSESHAGEMDVLSPPYSY